MEISHVTPEGWGLCPRIALGPLSVSVYAVFMLLAFIVGLSVYRYNAAKAGAKTRQIFPIVLAAIFGGVLGAKVPVWIMTIIEVPFGNWSLTVLLTGRTIVGGFIGGMLAVWWIKRRLNIQARLGNILAPGVALGLATGRIGCFLSGCCYGTPTALPVGVDFGDGIPRHATQLYEIIFCLIAFAVIQRRISTARPGSLMSGFLAAYFVFRFFEEYVRAGEIRFGLTPFQWICLAGLVLIGIRTLMFRRAAPKDGMEP